MAFDRVENYVLARDTLAELRKHARRVKECKGLDEAIEFARYLRQSGILKLLKANPQDAPLPVDGAFIEWTAEELERSVRAQYVKPSTPKSVAFCEVEKIRENLDLIAGVVAQLLPRRESVPGPVLRIVDSEGTDNGAQPGELPAARSAAEAAR